MTQAKRARNFTQGDVLETLYTWRVRIFRANFLLWEELEDASEEG
jgi:hypothetical protein